MPRKGPWTPPVYVGPPDEAPDRVSAQSAAKGRNRKAGPKCGTCFDLDLRYIPQPHKDQDNCSYGQVSRHWIKTSDLEKDKSCGSCRFLKSAFDTLLNSGEVINVPPGYEIGEYFIAILDRNDDDSADGEFKKRKKLAEEKYESSKSLIFEMRCGTRKLGSGKQGRNGTDEEFKVEIYTQPGGM